MRALGSMRRARGARPGLAAVAAAWRAPAAIRARAAWPAQTTAGPI